MSLISLALGALFLILAFSAWKEEGIFQGMEKVPETKKDVVGGLIALSFCSILNASNDIRMLIAVKILLYIGVAVLLYRWRNLFRK